jgi:hypothetical protein
MTTILSDRRSTRFVVVCMLAAAAMACRGPEGPVGPAGEDGRSPVLATVSGTSPLVIDESVLTYTPIPGLSTTVTVPAGSTYGVLIETDGGVQLNSTAPDAIAFTDVAVFVDGAQVGAGRRVSVSNNIVVIYAVGSYGFSVQTSLSAGTHTVTVMAKRFSATLAESYISSGANGSGLPGNPRLQGVLNVVAFP